MQGILDLPWLTKVIKAILQEWWKLWRLARVQYSGELRVGSRY
jgi:hypothetical protein